MKILLTGCNGQVGWELARALLPLGDVIAANRSQVDLSDPDGLRRIVQKVSPDVIVNPAAYTAVDKAETDRDMAFLINAEASRVLAEEAAKSAALLIHYSTDYVFDGTKNAPYTEDDATHPVNVYGQSKLAGEQAIQAAGADHLILRTSWVYAARGQNFLKTILRLAAEREELAIVADQIGSPTWARLIAETTAHILRQSLLERRQDHFNSSVYNLTSVGETSWHGFAQAIVEIARQQGMPALKNRIINPIPTTAYPAPAKRPLNSRLSTDRLEQRFGLKMPSWDAALRLCMADMT
ncbi:dTDP-4-dehydrorhamnose reductase [Methylobacter sp.]|uniref:dTDP-4-dehydrorhamnose reductase n=1 Tax=Methylobacter sp. TaxID=2051955 RepID=UPI003DA30636